MRLLAVIGQLGRTDVSTQVLVEAWQSQHLQVDENFFLHFDVLSEYGFVKICDAPAPLANLGNFIAQPEALEQQVSVTQAGVDFFERYHRF